MAEGQEDKVVSVMRNIVNLQAALGPSASIELVAHGPGLRGLMMDSPIAADVLAAASRGVTFQACGNTMSREGVTREQLLTGVGVVESGLALLVIRQQLGWAYVRP